MAERDVPKVREPMRIVYMGTPDIAATVLRRLIVNDHNIVAVITGEDKVRGRGKVKTPTPTKEMAMRHGIPTYEPKTLRDEAFAELLRELAPDLIVVVAYGKILPPSVLSCPKFGCINMHVSLLPKYRGAAPMQRAIINGERETGVTVMYMAEGLDTGDVISRAIFPIHPTDTFEDIHDRSADIGADLLSDTIYNVFAGMVDPVPQDDALATYAAKIEKSECKIDFTKSARELDCLIRGVTPIPGAFAYLGGKMLKIFNATPTDGVGEAGEVLSTDGVGDGSFVVACGEGALTVRGVIPEGKGKMSAGDFVRGRKIFVGDKLI